MDNDPRQNIPGEKGDHHNGTWVGIYTVIKGLPAMRETGFNPWVGNIPWRRNCQPTPVFLPGEAHGQRSLMG